MFPLHLFCFIVNATYSLTLAIALAPSLWKNLYSNFHQPSEIIFVVFLIQYLPKAIVSHGLAVYCCIHMLAAMVTAHAIKGKVNT